MGLGEEQRENAEQEVVLHLTHVGVETPVGVAVTLEVEERVSSTAGVAACAWLTSRKSIRAVSSNPSWGNTRW